MESLAGKEQERALREATLAWHLRNKKGASVEQIARRLKYGSVETLRRQFENWGLPAWIVGERSATPERKARNSGDAIELPRAANASELLRELVDMLDEGVGQLDGRTDYLQAGRFVTVYTSEEQWPPPLPPGGVSGPVTRFSFAGGSYSPPEPLTTLIAAYVLTGFPLPLLLERLQRKLDKDEETQLRDLIEGRKVGNGYIPGLRDLARNVARLVFGAQVKPGPKPTPVPIEDQAIGWWVQRFAHDGYSDEYIHRRLIEMGSISETVPVREIARIRKLRLPDPGLPDT